MKFRFKFLIAAAILILLVVVLFSILNIQKDNSTDCDKLNNKSLGYTCFLHNLVKCNPQKFTWGSINDSFIQYNIIGEDGQNNCKLNITNVEIINESNCYVPAGTSASCKINNVGLNKWKPYIDDPYYQVRIAEFLVGYMLTSTYCNGTFIDFYDKCYNITSSS